MDGMENAFKVFKVFFDGGSLINRRSIRDWGSNPGVPVYSYPT
jgi:hypothetical protein